MNLAICLIFFLSGASALIFETLWFRTAGLAFGNSVWASSLVLASFMAGLALGNAAIARFGPRLRRPLLTYAGLEVVIGATGWTLVLLIPALASLLAPMFRLFLDQPWLLNTLRLVSAFALLLIPSTAMGATLPVLVRTLSHRDSNFGRVLGRLYGWNALGAVAGALGAEIVLIGSLGVRGAGLFAAGLNLLAALLAVSLAPSYQRAAEGSPTVGGIRSLLPRDRFLLAATFLSGATLLGLEVVWFRFMLLFRNTTSLVFTLMLAAVLVGIAFGGLLASWWLRYRPEAYRYASLIALAAGIMVLFTYFGFAETLGLFSVLPVSLASGILFTFLGRALKGDDQDETLATAMLTLANTIGAMTGALVAGFVLLPLAGVELSFFLLALAYGGVTLFTSLAGLGEWRAVGSERLLHGAAATAFVACVVFFPFGLMRNHYVPAVLAPHVADGAKLLSMREGLTETSFYLEKDLFGKPRYHRMLTNGFSMSATVYRAKRYMKLFAYWPAALQPSPKRALLISYGIGVTAKALTDLQSLERIDVVDISEDVIDLSREVDIFPGGHPLDDPRVHVHVEDGRFFLQTTPETFDVITAEPPPPKNAGIVNLYSQEYFGLLRDRLATGGLMTYWLPVYQLRAVEAKSIVKAFCNVFSDCSLWTTAGTEWMLAGSRDLEGPIEETSFENLWQERPLELQTIGVERPEQLGALFLADSTFLGAWTEDALPLVDNYPHRIQSGFRQESVGDEDLDEYLQLMDTNKTRERFSRSEWIRRIWPPRLREQTLDQFDSQAIINQHLARGGAGIPELHQVLTGTSLRSLPLMLMASDEEDAPIVEWAHQQGILDPLLEFLLAGRAFSGRDYEAAAAHMARARELDPNSGELAMFEVLALLMNGQRDQAAGLVQALQRSGYPPPDHPFWAWVASNDFGDHESPEGRLP